MPKIWVEFSLDLIDTHSDLFVGLAIAVLLVSCSATGPMISGRVQDVSAADIDAAVAAFQGSIVDGPVRFAEIEVISHNEIRLHDWPAPSSYTPMVRVRGKWDVGKVVLVHPRY